MPWLKNNPASPIVIEQPSIIPSTPVASKNTPEKKVVTPAPAATDMMSPPAPPAPRLITRMSYKKDEIVLSEKHTETLFALIKFIKKHPELDVEFYGYSHQIMEKDHVQAAQAVAAKRLMRVHDFLRDAGVDMKHLRFYAPSADVLHTDPHKNRIDIAGIKRKLPADLIGPPLP